MKKLILFLALAMVITPLPASAKMGIIAVVNGQAISNFAVQDRVTLMMRTSGIGDSPAARQKLAAQALQMLINEELQRQDAKAQGVSVSDRDLQTAFSDLEQKNNLPTGSFRDYVARGGINPDSLVEQIKMQILWKKILAKQVQPFVGVSSFEVEEITNRQKNLRTITEVYLSEIILPVMQGDEKNALQVANQLVQELKGGADFGKVASQFSSSSAADSNGVIGWIDEDQLHGELRTAVKNAKENSLLPPIRTEEGYHIVKLGERRTREKDAPNAPTEDKIKAVLTAQKMDLEAKRYMKKLREKAVIELRN